MGRFSDLPNGIVSEILSRLPIEGVLDSKLVCKSWKNVVLHRSFSQMHLNHINSTGKLSFIFFIPKNNKEFLFTECNENFHERLFTRKTWMNLIPPFNKYDYGLVDSCNGLICFNSIHRDNAPEKRYYGPAYICNPITREYIMLPVFKRVYPWTGFGYVPSTNEYKVVRICAGSADLNCGNVEVYTLGSSNGWRNAGNIGDNIKYVSVGPGVFANGALHWVNKREGTILAFHLTDEKFIELPSPACLMQAGVSEYAVRLRALGDFLSATCYPNANSCDIWLLKKNKDNCDDLSWSKDFSCSFKFFDNYESQPFWYTKGGRLLCHGRNTIYSCNPKDSSGEMDATFGNYISKVIPHCNTLVSLKVLGEKDIKTMEFSEEQVQASRQKTASSREQTENSDKL